MYLEFQISIMLLFNLFLPCVFIFMACLSVHKSVFVYYTIELNEFSYGEYKEAIYCEITNKSLLFILSPAQA